MLIQYHKATEIHAATVNVVAEPLRRLHTLGRPRTITLADERELPLCRPYTALVVCRSSSTRTRCIS